MALASPSPGILPALHTRPKSSHRPGTDRRRRGSAAPGTVCLSPSSFSVLVPVSLFFPACLAAFWCVSIPFMWKAFLKYSLPWIVFSLFFKEQSTKCSTRGTASIARRVTKGRATLVEGGPHVSVSGNLFSRATSFVHKTASSLLL